MADDYTFGRFAWPKEGTSPQGPHHCAVCGRQIHHAASASGSAWRHDDTDYIRCDRKKED